MAISLSIFSFDNAYILMYIEMKRLIVSFFVILAGVFVVDRIGGLLMGWVNRHTSDITAPKIKYLSLIHI